MRRHGGGQTVERIWPVRATTRDAPPQGGQAPHWPLLCPYPIQHGGGAWGRGIVVAMAAHR
jgi:hypothetical protein